MKRKTFLRKKKQFRRQMKYRRKDILNKGFAEKDFLGYRKRDITQADYLAYDIGDKIMGGTIIRPTLIVIPTFRNGIAEDFWV